MAITNNVINKIQSGITSPSAARILFYPTLLWNIVSVGLSRQWRWYNRIDQNVVLGALPFRFQSRKLIDEEDIKGIVSLNETYETKGLMHSSEEWNMMGVKHLRLATPDFNNAPGVKRLHEGVDFITDCASSGSVYVHCKAGRGRSATLVACYLIKVFQMTPDKAINVLKENRPQTLLGSRQVKAINDFYERIQNGSRT